MNVIRHQDAFSTSTRYRRGELHEFEAGGNDFIYLVAAGAIFALDEAARTVLANIADEGVEHGALVAALCNQGHQRQDAEDLIRELLLVQGIVTDAPAARQFSSPEAPPTDFPLQALVLNITSQCNLACTYCYEFGSDKIATPQGKPKFMTLQTAKTSVDFLLEQSAARKAVHLTFFGGETLMNFRLLRDVVLYAENQAQQSGKAVTFSLTTNATLLNDEIIDFLSDHHVGVTVSMDGPPDLQNKHRVFKNGKGSYDVIEPRLRKLIDRHKSRAITARVTLTDGVTDVVRIFRHLKDDLGFHEVGFAPVTSSEKQDYSISDPDMNAVLRGFHDLADEWLDYALRGQMHGFSNVSETIGELTQGVNKSHPCGAGLGLLGVSPSGDLSPCHRFTDADSHTLGNINSGIDAEKRGDFLARGHIGTKYDCQTCWARPLCAGGCHHEAFVRYGDTGHANLHYCDWIREWTDTCLKIYGVLAIQKPEFLERFAERKPMT
ncbi:radical SAM family protein [Acetobacter nitrogenifigens DSM 23921 = NBRC 105050]|uniref:Thioether cross-link-forming SCIFF peptide maturase n=1 Tax=Acetobacter nitrogenifigens DSM 23921 = NBRC 105050 TaxID=1120919 RepID=A0A511XF30_9PROT|nr:quinohemoprotein amine dehydrogenase maturation protein [Acetobacter nitrogenifigens]GBQ92456.1 radical SAM family protein [Acetobacter nitrogenifigens DSM 23921 = NBRC 105050]GEN61566.1 thioether cross-link-forming SCIFF peptide maturase [Acetobacter nitrogenifigens DSM 23921 = NBRC 105050]